MAQLSATAAPVASGPEAVVVEREIMLRGIAGLTEVEREALLLTSWDGLAAAQAAMVARCSTTAFHVRLHRARRRLAGLVDGAEAALPPSVPKPSPEPTADPIATDPIATPRLSWRYQ